MTLGFRTFKYFSFCKLTAILVGLLAFHLAASVASSQTCISSTGSWANAALPSAQSGTFRVAHDATPSARIMNAIAGLSSSAARAYTDLAVAAHFASTGVINVPNGSDFTAASRVPYSPGVKYHFILDVNVSAHTYAAYVVVGSTQTTLGTNLKFPSEQSPVKSLNNLGDLSAQGALSICNMVVSAAPSSTKLILNPSATSLNFGKVSVSSSSNQNISLTNAGNSSVTISKVTVSGAGFNASGSVAGLILSPNQSASPEHYVFPHEKYGLAGNDRKPCAYEMVPTEPMHRWKVAWESARKTANVSCRFHDLRHTFISRLAESQASN